MGWDPNRTTFEQGAENVMSAIKSVGLDNSKIFTSRDEKVRELQKKLGTGNIPGGFKKWQLPVVLKRAQLFVSVASPDQDVPEHAHNDGDGVRYIVSGSISYGGHELSAGDWMFIPKGKRYSFKTGPAGATMMYCYECCCA